MYPSVRTSFAAVTAVAALFAGTASADIIHANGIGGFAQGLDRIGGTIATDRSSPFKALGTPEDNDTLNFVSLGLGGSITLSFEYRIKDQLRIVETTYNSFAYLGLHPESAEVFVGRGTNAITASYWSLGTLLNSQDNSWMSLSVADSASGFKSYDYLRIVDNTLSLPSLASGDGFDVDGVYAVAVPGPASALLLGLGGLAAARRRR